MKNGICLLCFGHESFGKLTYNLVASIKQYDDVHVTIFTDHKSISSVDKTIFDNIVDIPHSSFYLNGIKHPNRFKLCLNEISPYENTMYLDVDSLYMSNQKLSNLFEMLNDVDLIGQNEKIVDLNNTSKIFHGFDVFTFEPKFDFKNNLLHQLHGQFLLFKKNYKTKQFFDLSKTIYDKMDRKEITNIHEWCWFGRPIEELSITLTTGLLDIDILDNFAPVSVQSDNFDYNYIINNKLFLSICGSSTNELTPVGGYCINESYSKNYIQHYNNKIKDITNYKCFEYVEKVYEL